MATTKVLNIKVSVDGDVDVKKLENDIRKLTETTNDAKKSLKETGKETKYSLRGSQAAADRLSDGVSGVGEQFVIVAKAAKKGGIAMRSALISTGVGALIVALGYIADNWEEITRAINGQNDGLREQNNIIRENIEILDAKQKYYEAEKRLLKLKGESLDAIIEAEKNSLQNKRVELISLAANLATELNIEKSKKAQLSFQEKLINLGFKARGLSPIFSKQDEERAKELKKALDETNVLIVQNQEALFRLNNPEAGKNPKKPTGNARQKEKQSVLSALTAEEQQELLDKKSQQFEEIFDLEKTQEQRLLDSVKIAGEQLLADEDSLNAVRTERDKKYADARIKISQEEANAKRIAFLGYADALSTISGVLGTQTAEGKALAVASSLVNTYAAITGQLKAFSTKPIPGYAIAQAVATGVVGFANVKKILDVKIPNVSGSKGVSIPGGAEGGGAGAPAFNVVGNSGVSQLAQTLNQDQQPIEAYVVAGNVTSAQEINRNIVENATIG